MIYINNSFNNNTISNSSCSINLYPTYILVELISITFNTGLKKINYPHDVEIILQIFCNSSSNIGVCNNNNRNNNNYYYYIFSL